MSAPLLLTVCTGNVCRSPLLERLLQHHLDDAHGAGAVEVRSGGTGALVGAGMDDRSAALLRDLGGDPTGFVARRLTGSMVSQASLVLTATREHRAAVVRLDPRAMRRTFTVREFAELLRHVPDEQVLSLDWSDPGQALVDLGARARGARGSLVTRGARGDDLDIVDPYRRDDAVYELVREQVGEALPALLRGLTGARAAG